MHANFNWIPAGREMFVMICSVQARTSKQRCCLMSWKKLFFFGATPFQQIELRGSVSLGKQSISSKRVSKLCIQSNPRNAHTNYRLLDSFSCLVFSANFSWWGKGGEGGDHLCWKLILLIRKRRGKKYIKVLISLRLGAVWLCFVNNEAIFLHTSPPG